jgi:hypothetical protein
MGQREYPRFDYGVEDVKRVSAVIAGDLHWTSETEALIREAFQIANNWRDAHAFPMRSVRGSLRWYMHHYDIAGVTAARLKRMQAIRRKLARPGLRPLDLHLMQDLGGCRVIVSSIADVRRLVDLMRSGRHTVHHESPHIDKPKKDGYRSHHMILEYCGRGPRKLYDGKRVEVQVRTRMQHSWATTVEAVGLLRGEDLKGNKGSADWLRLFFLMSAEFARAENCAEPPKAPSHKERCTEIIALDKKLEASKHLQNMSNAFQATDDLVENPLSKPTYYLLKFDNATKQMSVEPYFAPKEAMLQYDNAEELDNHSDTRRQNVVLVEADKLENLKVAYPNYFGDVQLFKMQLGKVIKGKPVQEYTVRPQETVAARPREPANLAWLKGRSKLRWK